VSRATTSNNKLTNPQLKSAGFSVDCFCCCGHILRGIQHPSPPLDKHIRIVGCKIRSKANNSPSTIKFPTVFVWTTSFEQLLMKQRGSKQHVQRKFQYSTRLKRTTVSFNTHPICGNLPYDLYSSNNWKSVVKG
jgi:hypothetical protein